MQVPRLPPLRIWSLGMTTGMNFMELWWAGRYRSSTFGMTSGLPSEVKCGPHLDELRAALSRLPMDDTQMGSIGLISGYPSPRRCDLYHANESCITSGCDSSHIQSCNWAA